MRFRREAAFHREYIIDRLASLHMMGLTGTRGNAQCQNASNPWRCHDRKLDSRS